MASELEQLKEWLSSKVSGGNSAPASGSSPKIDNTQVDGFVQRVGKAAEAVTPLYFGFQKLTTGADTASTAVNAMASGISAVGLPGLAGMSKDLATAFLTQKNNMDKASAELGIGANNIGTFVRMSGNAGLTTEQFTETIKKTDGLMSGLAGSSQRGAEAFSKVQKTLIESNAGEALNAIGIRGKELADMTALSMSNNTKLNLKTAAGQAEAAAAAGQLAFELDATSKITGQSREALANTLKAEEQKPNEILMQMQMTKEQLAGYKDLKTQMAGFGPSFQSLSAEIASGGVRTKEGLKQMEALGSAGTEFQNATKMMINAKDDEQKEAAKAALDQAQAAINQRMASKQYNDMMQFGTAEQKAAIAGQVSGYKGLQAAQKAAQDADGDYAKGRKNQLAEAAAMEKDQKVDENGKPVVDKDGKAVQDEGTETAKALNAANRQATIQAGGMAQNFEQLNGKLGGSKAALDGFKDALGFVGKSAKMNDAEKAQKAAPKEATNELFNGKPSAAPSDTSKLGNKAKLADGGIVEPKPGGTDATIGEGGKAEAVIPLDKLQGMLGGVPATISSATGAKPVDTGKGKGELEMVLSDYQKTVLKYAATEGEMKQVQLDNEKNIIRGTEAQITESKQRIANIQKDADGRELTQREQNRIQKINEEIKGFEQQKATQKEALAVFENIDKLKAQTSTDSKKSELAETTKQEEAKKNAVTAQAAFSAIATMSMTDNQKKMFGDFYSLSKEDSEKKKAGLAEEQASAQAANKAALAARDAIEEKAELEGRTMTEAEQAQHKTLGVELNSSFDRIEAARSAQKVLASADQEKEMQAKIEQSRSQLAKESVQQATEIAKVGAKEQEAVQKGSQAKSVPEQINAGISKVTGAQPSELMDKVKAEISKVTGAQPTAAMEQIRAELAKTKPKEVGSVTEQFNKMSGSFGSVGASVGGYDPFNPKIVDAKAAEEQKAKIAEQKAAAAKTSEATKPQPKAEEKKEEKKPEAKPADKKETATPAGKDATLNDLKEQLVQLNKHMTQLINHSETAADAAHKTAKNSAKFSGSRN